MTVLAASRGAGDAEATRLLTELGLTVNEARVYLALLRRFDSPTAAEAAVAAGVPRPKVYEALQSLEGRGFSKSIGGRVRRFTPVEPETALRGIVGTSVPLHDGAVKYYKDKGLLK